MRLITKILLRTLICISVIIVLTILITRLVTSPANDRTWNTDQEVLPYADISGDRVSIFNIRNFSYASTTSYTPAYYHHTYDLQKLKRVWYVVEPFSGIPGSAHTFVSFEFEGDVFVAISVEIRKERGEDYHPIKGLFNQYELMYVIADERDVVKLRSNYRKDQVYVYPASTTPEKARALFLDMVTRATHLKEYPEFYNTLTNTCTTNIVEHINNITPSRIPWYDFRILFPENSDQLAYEQDLIDTALSFEDMRTRYHINDRAMKYADALDFSVRIRGER
ncbi:MAG: DUF4105 domain-containing protein [Patescibacteria group bacterium]